MKWYLGHETKFMYSGLYFTDMELNNFNEYIVVTTDRVKNHQFCCGAFVIPLGVPTSIIGILGLVKLILSLIYSNHLGGVIAFVSHGVWSLTFISFVSLWYCRCDLLGNTKESLKALQIHMTFLTTSGIIVSLIMTFQYFNYSDSWKVDNAEKAAVLCFYIFDMVANLSFEINTYFCQVEMELQEE